MSAQFGRLGFKTTRHLFVPVEVGILLCTHLRSGAATAVLIGIQGLLAKGCYFEGEAIATFCKHTQRWAVSDKEVCRRSVAIW